MVVRNAKHLSSPISYFPDSSIFPYLWLLIYSLSPYSVVFPFCLMFFEFLGICSDLLRNYENDAMLRILFSSLIRKRGVAFSLLNTEKRNISFFFFFSFRVKW